MRIGAATAVALLGAVIPSSAWAACPGWTSYPSPNPTPRHDLLLDVASVTANDAWAVGTFGTLHGRTLVVRWNGTSWRRVASPNPAPLRNVLSSVSAVAAGDVWAVGEFGRLGRSLAEHWDGTRWRVIPTPNPSRTGNTLYSVSAITANDVWAVGTTGSAGHTLALHWDGSAWHRVATPDPGGQQNALGGVVALTSTNVWAVGLRAGQYPLLEHWNGSAWSVVAGPASASVAVLAAADASGANDVWAVGVAFASGVRPIALRRNAGGWTVQSPSINTESQLGDVVDFGPGNVWVVGYVGSGRPQALVQHWAGSAWNASTPVRPGQSSMFLGAGAISAPARLWAVGTVTPSGAAGSVQRTLIEQHC
jgi:hypothetical protein